MTGRYQAYPEYKESGLDWLGVIPDQWTVIQSRRLFTQRKERARPDDEQLTASQKHGVIYQKQFMEIENQRVVQVITGSDILKHVEANDFVISMRSFQGGLEWCRYSGSVSSAYVGLIPIKHVVPEFFAYLFKCYPYIQALQSTSNLVRDGQALRFENFSQVSLPVIPDDEQKSIARFLDHETAKIDTLIEKQQQLIQLLKEKRQAVISHAVTKGLNPDVPMRDSGVEWLGEVPEHWEVKRIKHLSTLISKGTTPSTIGGDFVDSGVRFLKAENIGKSLSVSSSPEFYITKEVNLQISRSQLEDDDVLVIIAGATTGLSSILEKELLPANTNQAVSFIRPIQKNHSILIARWLSTEFSQRIIWMGAVQAAQPNLSMEDLGNIPITIPPIQELLQIMEKVDAKLSKLDMLISKAQSAIEFMQERRTALISAAVTGKIDVRNWQPPKTNTSEAA